MEGKLYPWGLPSGPSLAAVCISFPLMGLKRDLTSLLAPERSQGGGILGLMLDFRLCFGPSLFRTLDKGIYHLGL